MSDYLYGPPSQITFGTRDTLAPGEDAKVVSGADFDVEFDKLVVAVNSKLNHTNPTFTGVMNGDAAEGSSINGGTY
jgi:hypothetical protein